MIDQNQRQTTSEAKQRIIMQAIELVEKQYQDSSQLSEDKSKEKVDIFFKISVMKIATQGRWTQSEHSRFLEALSLYGKNWKKVEEHIHTRSGAQIRSHAQKFFNRLERETNMPFNGLKSAQIKSIFEERVKLQNSSKKELQNLKVSQKSQEVTIKQNQEKICKKLEEKPQIEQEINQFFKTDINQLSQFCSMINKQNLSNILNSMTQQFEEKPIQSKQFGMNNFQPPYLAQILQGQEKRDRKLSDLIDFNCENKNQGREISQSRSRKGSFILYQDQDSTQQDKYESLKKSKNVNLAQSLENQEQNIGKNTF